ncbi:MAG: arginase family protein [Patescibacteria group bacterium]|mgnify:FL=1
MIHATFPRRIIEKYPKLKIVHIGSRAATKDEWKFASEHQFSVITTNEILISNNFMNKLKSILVDIESVYISIDLDVLDPAYAPGVANPEACGISTHQLLDCLYLLKEKNIKGFDIVELCPQYDPSGITAIAAAKFLAELCCLINLKYRKIIA